MKEKIINIIKAILREYLKLLKSDSLVKHLFASSIMVFMIFYLVFIMINRIDLLLVTFSGAELILFIKRVFQFCKSEI